ncbi:type VI secretion system-associated protein TagF [Neorhizobium lilium]|uniref:Type VI secretion system-associated protein TagF n=1 Tax=Neorhizobium lilium TaxID=2503024 RepID=A0A3S3T3X5_9HYPH|nr:type VI secretion system-associated protein TagF [Neorhizobium lilium]RWX81504.1 type VI secretion system-associated protein TagF [Neorhizobium lilium]
MAERAALEQNPTDTDRLGFFGKLRTHGDFVSIGMGRSLQTFLDAWLQAGLQAVQRDGGSDWERQFRAMPSWRFVVGRALWGPATIAGIIVPSLDRVGRSFPLVLAAQLHDFAGHPRRIRQDETWFTAAEAIAETCLRKDFDIDNFTSRLSKLRGLRPADLAEDDFGPNSSSVSGSLWWRIDPQDRQVREFRSVGAPLPEHFAKLVHNGSAGPVPEPRPVQSQSQSRPVAPAAPVGASARLTLEHRYAIHPGTRLTVTADAVLIAQNPVLFAVADGVGDGNGAVEASRLAIHTLSKSAVQDTIEALVQEVKGKLGRAHGLLQSAHLSFEREPSSASIVVLCVVQDRFALLWAGDARCYLIRHGMMRCLTRDHIEIGLKRKLSRSIGTKGQLVPEVLSGELEPGDRIFLCSAPLPRVLRERSMAEILLSSTLDEVSNVLIQEGLIANCRDNISVLVIDVTSNEA